MKHWWTPERKAELRHLWTEGVSLTEIALRLGNTSGAIYMKVREENLPLRGRESYWNSAKVDRLVKMWQAGKSASFIAAALFGVSRCAVMGKVHRLKLPKRTNGYREFPPDMRWLKVFQKKRHAHRGTLLHVSAKAAGSTNSPTPVSPSPLISGILNLAPRTCRWPYDGDMWCGHKVQPDFSYCPYHKRISCVE